VQSMTITSFLGMPMVVYAGDPLQIADEGSVPLDDMAHYYLCIPIPRRLVLLEQHRMTDPYFLQMINKICRGEIDTAVHQYMCSLPVNPQPGPNDFVIVTKRRLAHEINTRIVRDLPDKHGELRTFAPRFEVCVRSTYVTATRKKIETWRDIDPESEKSLLDAAATGQVLGVVGKPSAIEAQKEELHLRLGVPVFTKYNDNATYDIRNGTPKTVVGFTREGYPICASDAKAAEFLAETGNYGYYNDDPDTIVVNPIESIYTVSVRDSRGQYKQHRVRSTRMPLWPRYACTVHCMQGQTVHRPVIVDARRSQQWTNGLLFVAVTRSTDSISLLHPWTRADTFKLDEKAIQRYTVLITQMHELILPRHHAPIRERLQQPRGAA
jgi:hypothetical protein